MSMRSKRTMPKTNEGAPLKRKKIDASAPSVEQTNKIGPVKEGNTVANVGDMLDKEHDDDDTVGSDLSDLEELEHKTGAVSNDNDVDASDDISNEERDGAGEGKLGAHAQATVDAFSFSTLQRVGAVTLVNSDTYTTPTVVNFNATFDSTTVLRLRKIELFEPKGYLKNLATANPEDYAMVKFITPKASAALQSQTQVRGTHFFLVGTVRYSALMGPGSSQICIAVSDRTFPRAVAVLGQILRHNALFVPTYRDGVSFGTFRNAKKEPDSPVKQGLKSFASTSSNSVVIGPLAPNVRPFGQPIPTFDGTRAFDLMKVDKLERWEGELFQDSAVLVTFTIGSYTNSSAVSYNGNNVVTALSLNAQFIVLLAPPSEGRNVDFNRAPDAAVGVTAEVPFVIDVAKPMYDELGAGELL